MKPLPIAALAVCLTMGLLSTGCESLESPFYTAAKKKINQERAEFDAEITKVQDGIFAELDKERESARVLTNQRAEVEKEYAHATVDHQFGLRAIDEAIAFNVATTNANISKFEQTLEAIDARRERAQQDWADREESARAADEWVNRVAGAGMAAIPGAAGAIGLSLFMSRRSKNATAAEFRDAIAAGRSEEEVDRIITGDTALGRALRQLMARRPDIKKVVEKDKLHKPVTATEVAS